jgi:hypothetical protein
VIHFGDYEADFRAGEMRKQGVKFKLQETAYRERDPWMLLLKTEAGFDDLRSDPRFQDLLRRMNFPT